LLCLDCGYDTETADLVVAMAVLADAEARVAPIVDELRRRTAMTVPGGDDVERVLELCDVLEGARRALLGVSRGETAGGGRRPTSMYAALAVLSSEASWLQRASRASSPRSQRWTPPPEVAATAHALEHTARRLRTNHSAGETSPLS
jgi:hypothetical protein